MTTFQLSYDHLGLTKSGRGKKISSTKHYVGNYIIFPLRIYYIRLNVYVKVLLWFYKSTLYFIRVFLLLNVI